MLQRRHRMTAAADFQQAIRSGRRYGTPTLVANFWCCDDSASDPRVGFAVGKAVGNAVARHQVARRLRHIVACFVSDLPPGGLLVVRALPAAADANSAALEADLRRALSQLARRP